MNQNPYASMLEMFMHPVFLVKDGIITDVNQSAKDHQISTGTKVSDFIVNGLEEYEAHSGICLSLTLRFCDCEYIASVFRQDQWDVFQISSAYGSSDLKAIALAAKQLRGPLANTMVTADRLFPNPALGSDDTAQKQIRQINRNLYQLLRTINNMADASGGVYALSENRQIMDAVSIFRDIMKRTTEMAKQANRKLEFKGPKQKIYCLTNQHTLERAVYNLISNAIKFSPDGSRITATLVKKGDKLLFSIENPCENLNSESIKTIFSRYQRQPGTEDSRHGLGLGIRIVQNAASIHGGALLLEQPAEDTIRFTMTISLKQDHQINVRTPAITILPGGYDEALVELSEILPESYFGNIN